MKKVSVTVFISSIGTIFEWYDFTIFAYMSGVMSKSFFPSSDKRVSLLLFFATFMISYIVRPLGGLVFGYIGDNYSRKISLLMTLSTMAGATLLIGLLPTYSELGILAPLFLIALRIVQGLSVGGEVIGATTFILEKFESKKSFLTSIIWASSGIGILLASLASTLLSSVLDVNQLNNFGWRIPFLFGAGIGVIGVFLRNYITDSEKHFYNSKKNKVKESFITTLLKQKEHILVTFCLYVLCANITYILFVEPFQNFV